MSEENKPNLKKELKNKNEQNLKLIEENKTLSENYKAIDKTYQDMRQKYSNEKDRNDKIRKHQEQLEKTIATLNSAVEDLRGSLSLAIQEKNDNETYYKSKDDRTVARLFAVSGLIDDIKQDRTY